MLTKGWTIRTFSVFGSILMHIPASSFWRDYITSALEKPSSRIILPILDTLHVIQYGSKITRALVSGFTHGRITDLRYLLCTPEGVWGHSNWSNIPYAKYANDLYYALLGETDEAKQDKMIAELNLYTID